MELYRNQVFVLHHNHIEPDDDQDEIDDVSYHRVLYVDYYTDKCSTIDIYSRTVPVWRCLSQLEHMIETGEAGLLNFDPFSYRNQPESEIPSKQREDRDKAFSTIEKLVGSDKQIFKLLSRRSRGELIRKHSKERGATDCSLPNRNTVEKHLRHFFQRGMNKNAVRLDYPNCGAPGKVRVTKENMRSIPKLGAPSRVSKIENRPTGINCYPEIRELIYSVCRRNKKRFKKKEYKKLWKKLLKQNFFIESRKTGEGKKKIFCSIGIGSKDYRNHVLSVDHPTYSQFYYWAKEYWLEFFENDLIENDLITRSSDIADYPTHRYQIDAWIADVYVVDHIDRSKILGRPIVYIVIDVYSHAIVGIHITLQNPSWDAAMIALHNAMTPKGPYCKRFGIDLEPGDWDISYTPDEVYADRGETETKKAEAPIKILKIHFINGPAFKPSLRGLVEGLFNLIKVKVFGELPAEVKKTEDPDYRRGPDYRLDASISDIEFEIMMIHFSIKHNHYHIVPHGNERHRGMIEDDILPTPMDIWNWGKKNMAGGLFKHSPDLIKVNLLPRKKIKVHKKRGLVILWGKGLGLRFTCDDEYEIRKQYGGLNLPIACFEKIDHAYLILDEGLPTQRLVPLKLHEHSNSFTGLTYEEYYWTQEWLKYKKSLLEEESTLAEIKFLSSQDDIIKMGKHLAREAKSGKTKKELLSTIRHNLLIARDEEKMRQMSFLGLNMGDENYQPPHSTIPTTAKNSKQTPKYPVPGRMSDLIKESKEKENSNG